MQPSGKRPQVQSTPSTRGEIPTDQTNNSNHNQKNSLCSLQKRQLGMYFYQQPSQFPSVSGLGKFKKELHFIKGQCNSAPNQELLSSLSQALVFSYAKWDHNIALFKGFFKTFQKNNKGHDVWWLKMPVHYGKLLCRTGLEYCLNFNSAPPRAKGHLGSCITPSVTKKNQVSSLKKAVHSFADFRL